MADVTVAVDAATGSIPAPRTVAGLWKTVVAARRDGSVLGAMSDERLYACHRSSRPVGTGAERVHRPLQEQATVMSVRMEERGNG